MALDATIGGAASNSYNSAAEIDTYITTRLFNKATLIAASGAMREEAAKLSTLLLDTRLDWTGSPTDPTVQVLAWPRTGMTNRNGQEIPSNVLPAELKRAHAELTSQLLEANRLADNDVERMGITDLKVGSIELSFKDEVNTKGKLERVIPDAVRLLLVPTWYTLPVITPEWFVETT
jgi:hypothetical protein